MAPSKTPGGQAPSDKFLKKEAAAHGLGAENAPAHKDGKAPGEVPVASDSGVGAVGWEEGGATNIPGEKGLKEAVPGSAAPGPAEGSA